MYLPLSEDLFTFPLLVGENIFHIAFGAVVTWTIYGAIYRLYLSPISHFPGPNLAALTFWYEFYYDIYPHFGQYTNHLLTLHTKYGPIIRINPYELHIMSPPSFYETLYSSSKKRDKWYWLTKMFGLDDSLFATVDHDVHRMRRKPMDAFFGVRSVRALQGMVEERVDSWIGRLRELRDNGKGEVHKVLAVTSAFSNDVIMKYSFGRTYNRLESPDFDLFNHESNHEAGKSGFVMKHFIWILRILFALPESWLAAIGPDLAALVELRHGMRKQIASIIAEAEAPDKTLTHPTIFHSILKSDLPASEKSVERLTDEANTIIGAGQETVAWILTVIVTHLLSKPDVLRKLKEELLIAIPDPNVSIPESTLANLPYLMGVIKEGLRLGHGVTTRLQRVPHEPLLFPGDGSNGKFGKQWLIPAWTPTSMTSIYMHTNPTIFPSPKEFKPERWVEDAQKKELERYLVAFTKGSRQCLGMNLAYVEMVLWVGKTFRRFGSAEFRMEGDEGVLDLVECGLGDVEIVGDRFVPIVREGSKGIRFRVLP